MFERNLALMMTTLKFRCLSFERTTAAPARPNVFAIAFLNVPFISKSNFWIFSFLFREIVGADPCSSSTQRKNSVKVSSHCLHGGFFVSKMPYNYIHNPWIPIFIVGSRAPVSHEGQFRVVIQ